MPRAHCVVVAAVAASCPRFQRHLAADAAPLGTHSWLRVLSLRQDEPRAGARARRPRGGATGAHPHDAPHLARTRRYDCVRAIFVTNEEMEAESALRRWGDWIFSAMLPCEVGAYYLAKLTHSRSGADGRGLRSCSHAS